MNVNFYTFSKRRNSTKQPAGSGTIISCELKEGTSVKNPKLTITGDVFGYNYAYIGDFGRYYFVNDVISEAKGLTTYILEEDSLASNKTAIGSTVARIAFSSTGYDKYLPDPRIGVSTAQHLYSATAASGFSLSSGYYVLGIAGKFGVSYKILDAANFLLLMTNLMNDTLALQLREVFSNPMDCITSCIWLPYLNENDAGGASGNITVGNLELDGTGGTIAVTGTTVMNEVITVKNAQGYSAVSLVIPYKNNDFRDLQPYTSASLYLPGIGETDLNINDFIGSLNVSINARIDVTTGAIIYRIYDDNGIVLKTCSFQGGVSIPLSALRTDVAGAISNTFGYASGTSHLMQGIPAGNLSASLSMITSLAGVAMSLNTRSTSIKGSYSGRSDFADSNYTLTLVCKDTEDPDNANYIATVGRPVCAAHAISNHSGYVQCEGASVSIGGESWERDQINSFLNSGFFYE